MVSGTSAPDVTAQPSAYPGADFAEWVLRGTWLGVLQSKPSSGASSSPPRLRRFWCEQKVTHRYRGASVAPH